MKRALGPHWVTITFANGHIANHAHVSPSGALQCWRHLKRVLRGHQHVRDVTTNVRPDQRDGRKADGTAVT